MNATLKNILIVSAKNAVNALIVNAGASQLWPQLFNIHTKAGLWAFAQLIGTVVGSRELVVWLPIVLKWSQTNGANMIKSFSLIILLFFTMNLIAQTSTTGAFPTTSVTFNLAPISLPGAKTSVAGAETDVMIAPSTSLEVGSSTLIGSTMVFTGARANYFVKSLSTFIQNHSPNLNGYQFQIGPTFSLGVVKPVGLVGNPHWAERAGFVVNYALNGQWGMGVDAEWGNFPGTAHNTWTLAFGPNFHF